MHSCSYTTLSYIFMTEFHLLYASTIQLVYIAALRSRLAVFCFLHAIFPFSLSELSSINILTSPNVPAPCKAVTKSRF